MGEACVCGWLKSAIRSRGAVEEVAHAQLSLWHESGWDLLVCKAWVLLRVYMFCAVWSRTVTACLRALLSVLVMHGCTVSAQC